MKIKKIKFENFRLFENLEIDFPDSNFIALIGNNGAGKTSILDGIALCFTHFTQDLLSKRGEYVLQSDSRFVNDDITIGKDNGFVNIQFDFEIPAANLFVGHNNQLKNISISKSRTVIGSSYEKKPDGFVNQVKDIILTKRLNSLPIIAYYNVNRTSTGKGDEKDVNTYDEKLYAYLKTLNLNSPIFEDFELWFLKQEIKENALKVRKGDLSLYLPSLRNVQLALKKYLQAIGIDNYDKVNILRESEIDNNFTENTKEFLSLKKGEKDFKFTQLSAGEKMIILLVVDIARRLTIANENSENALNGQGIVLIDELELHLHPTWQLKIVKALKETFPHVQFIATTHSPEIISNLKQEEVLTLENGHIYHSSQNPLGRDANSILEEIMHSTKRPAEIEAKISEIFNKLSAKELDFKLIDSEINILKSVLSEDDPIFTRINAVLERKKLLRV